MTKSSDAEILRAEEANDILQSEADPITSALLRNANFWFLKKVFEDQDLPVAGYDYAFTMEVLRAIFSEHTVLRQILAGEKVGQFFEEHEERAGTDAVLTAHRSRGR